MPLWLPKEPEKLPEPRSCAEIDYPNGVVLPLPKRWVMLADNGNVYGYEGEKCYGWFSRCAPEEMQSKVATFLSGGDVEVYC